MDVATCSLWTCSYLQCLYGFVAHLWIDLIRNILENKVTVERYVGSLQRGAGRQGRDHYEMGFSS